MKDDKEPTINLKNINYINTVERYQRKAKGSFDFLAPTSVRSGGFFITGDAAKEYYEKHQYMMRDRMCELFIKNESIPLDDKKQIEFWFNQEYKELNASLKEIKETMRKRYAESNDLYNEIERLVDEIQVTQKHIRVEGRDGAREEDVPDKENAGERLRGRFAGGQQGGDGADAEQTEGEGGEGGEAAEEGPAQEELGEEQCRSARARGEACTGEGAAGVREKNSEGVLP
eukprot:TRINITY_DN4311_c0_g4_i1.p1 TRINITY_DN4311_c0_g4~~TRINITY_DN4311_c0_g4_i1.p1  ORF type:complete len:230 (+),score=35.79 TRINITY_DN4311_c0_g4_i1:558-1247(+)